MAGYYQVPLGYRFMPRDDELLLHYLRPKLDGQDYPKGLVHDCDLYGLQEPSDIWRRLSRASHDGQECTDDKDIYIFTTLNSKAPNGSRFSRTVGTAGGTWKGEAAGKKIYGSGFKHAIGFKKRFTYRNKGSPQENHWIMHEFHLDQSLLRKKHHQEEKNIVLCILRRKDDISKKRKLEERDNYEENAANHFQPHALNAINVGDYNNAPSYMEQIAFDHFQPPALTATTIGDYSNDPSYTEENAADHFQPQALNAINVGDYNNAPSDMEQIAFDHFQPLALTATTIGDYSNDPSYTEENAADHFQSQNPYAATTGDYSNAHWNTEQNPAGHFEPHDEAHNANNEDLTTALRRMKKILMSRFRG